MGHLLSLFSCIAGCTQSVHGRGLCLPAARRLFLSFSRRRPLPSSMPFLFQNTGWEMPPAAGANWVWWAKLIASYWMTHWDNQASCALGFELFTFPDTTVEDGSWSKIYDCYSSCQSAVTVVDWEIGCLSWLAVSAVARRRGIAACNACSLHSEFQVASSFSCDWLSHVPGLDHLCQLIAGWVAATVLSLRAWCHCYTVWWMELLTLIYPPPFTSPPTQKNDSKHVGGNA